MAEIIKNFKDIMSDREERFEFVGSMICVIAFLFAVWFFICVFG